MPRSLFHVKQCRHRRARDPFHVKQRRRRPRQPFHQEPRWTPGPRRPGRALSTEECPPTALPLHRRFPPRPAGRRPRRRSPVRANRCPRSPAPRTDCWTRPQFQRLPHLRRERLGGDYSQARDRCLVASRPRQLSRASGRLRRSMRLQGRSSSSSGVRQPIRSTWCYPRCPEGRMTMRLPERSSSQWLEQASNRSRVRATILQLTSATVRSQGSTTFQVQVLPWARARRRLRADALPSARHPAPASRMTAWL